MKSGSNGTITFSINCIIMIWKSLTTPFSVEFSWKESPKPSKKAKAKADITSRMGGILILKYGCRSLPDWTNFAVGFTWDSKREGKILEAAK